MLMLVHSGVQEFLDKHNYKCTDAKGKLNRNIRFKESSFEFGEQIAVLGIVRNVTDEEGNERKVLFPVRTTLTTNGFTKLAKFSLAFNRIIFIHHSVATSFFVLPGGQGGVYRRVLRLEGLVGLGAPLLAGPDPQAQHHPHGHARVLPGQQSKSNSRSKPYYNCTLSMLLFVASSIFRI